MSYQFNLRNDLCCSSQFGNLLTFVVVLKKSGLCSIEHRIYLLIKENIFNQLLMMIFLKKFLESMKSIVACQVRVSDSMVLKVLTQLLYNFYLYFEFTEAR